MSKTRYNWLVDGQPTQNRYTVMGDVTRSIEVGMEFETPCGTDVKSHGILSHGFQERITGIRRNNQFQT